MTPAELKQQAIEATKKEYEQIMELMKKAASEGAFGCEFYEITEAAQLQLKEAGFKVNRHSRIYRDMRGNASTSDYFEVSFK